MTLHTLTLGSLRRYVGAQLPRIDRAWLAFGLVLFAVAVFIPDRLVYTVTFTGESLLGIAPYLAVSVLLAAWLKAAGADHLIAKVFSGHAFTMIVMASLFGSLSPFCSCGVIPIIAALLAMGVPLPPVMAFWLSSPVMAPDMFFLTAGALGWHFAVGKTLVAFGMGMLGGLGTQGLMRMGGLSDPLQEGVGNGGCAASSVRAPKDVRWWFWPEEGRRDSFLFEARNVALFLIKWMTLAFALESLMIHYLPPDLVGQWLGTDSLWAIPLAVVVGVPAYLNGYAAVPVMAGLIQTGMAPGAAMAFMTAGAVTSIPAAIAVYALVRKPVFLWYLLLALVGSSVAGLLYQIAPTF